MGRQGPRRPQQGAVAPHHDDQITMLAEPIQGAVAGGILGRKLPDLGFLDNFQPPLAQMIDQAAHGRGHLGVAGLADDADAGKLGTHGQWWDE